MENKTKIIISAVVVVVAILIFFDCGGAKNKQVAIEIPDIQDVVAENYEGCSNLSLFKTSICLVSWVNSFYNYTETDDKLTSSLSLDKLIEKKSGDCLDYSRIYSLAAKELGLYSKVVTVDIDESNMHAVAILSNEEGLCILNLNVKPECYLRCKNCEQGDKNGK